MVWKPRNPEPRRGQNLGIGLGGRMGAKIHPVPYKGKQQPNVEFNVPTRGLPQPLPSSKYRGDRS